VVICLERGADLHTTQLMPLPLTVSCFSKIQISFTFLVPAHPDSPGQRAVKWVCVCVCKSMLWPNVGSRTATEQNRTERHVPGRADAQRAVSRTSVAACCWMRPVVMATTSQPSFSIRARGSHNGPYCTHNPSHGHRVSFSIMIHAHRTNWPIGRNAVT